MGALALFASAALVATSGPAYSEDAEADLELTVSATTVTAGESVKDLATTVVNKGPAASSSWTMEYDFSGLDDSMVKVGPPKRGGL